MFNTTIVGNVTKDAVVRESGSQKVCSFTLAVRTNHKGTDGNYETEFVDCSLWGKRAETAAPYIKKGIGMTVIGPESIRRFEYNGEKRAAVNVEVQDFNFNTKKSDSAPAAAPKAAAPVEVSTDDLPF